MDWRERSNAPRLIDLSPDDVQEHEYVRHGDELFRIHCGRSKYYLERVEG